MQGELILPPAARISTSFSGLSFAYRNWHYRLQFPVTVHMPRLVATMLAGGAYTLSLHAGLSD